jgi:glucuronate isomerase
MRELGADVGVDSVGDWSQAQSLGAYLRRLVEENALPKVVVYNLNPADNYVLATMIGNFPDGSTPGKIQFGSGWWFLDQKEAMEWQCTKSWSGSTSTIRLRLWRTWKTYSPLENMSLAMRGVAG